MIQLCPYCGFKIGHALVDGITTCDNCLRIFDSSTLNKILSASWVVRKWHIEDPSVLEFKFGFSPEEIAPVQKFVIEQGLCHEEFIKKIA